MTDSNPPSSNIPADIDDPSKWAKFAYVVDGEVADITFISVSLERRVAVYQSNPVIVPFTSEQGVVIGDIYINGEFAKGPAGPAAPPETAGS